MSFIRSFQWLSVVCLLVGFSYKAHADGGIVRLRDEQGPFIVTVFTASDVVRDAPSDISVLVQSKDSNDAILDATVGLTFNPPLFAHGESHDEFCGPTPSENGSFSVQASRDLASNKLLYAAPARFGTRGNWRLDIVVKRGTTDANLTCVIPVGAASLGFANLVPYLLLPPFVVALFLTNQFLRRRLSSQARQLQIC